MKRIGTSQVMEKKSKTVPKSFAHCELIANGSFAQETGYAEEYVAAGLEGQGAKVLYIVLLE